MPTRDPHAALQLDQALDLVGKRAFRAAADPDAANRSRAVGLEQERFLVELGPDGAPGARLSLHGHGGVAARVLSRARVGDSLLLPADETRYPPVVLLAGGGNLSFEPGGQIEHSTSVHGSASAALADLRAVVHKLEQIFDPRRFRLVAVGLDPWHGPSEVPQQLEALRYRAMEEYFARIGPAGAYMMRLSCSLQVNLDHGSGRVLEERWLLANLLSPALTALFSTSRGPMDGEEWASRRARVWQTIDPSRASLPSTLSNHPTWTPARQYAEAALDAGVMVVRDGTLPGGGAAGDPRWTMRQWIQTPHPRFGSPTAEDLEYHLSTLFFDVRARGFLELRAVDALPYCFRPAPVAFVCGLLYDDQARGAALDLLAGKAERVRELYQRAARFGLSDGEVRDDARALFRLGLEGAARLGEGFLTAADLASAAQFGERFPERGLAPADEFQAALERGPAEGLEWAMSTGCGGCAEAAPALASAPERAAGTALGGPCG